MQTADKISPKNFGRVNQPSLSSFFLKFRHINSLDMGKLFFSLLSESLVTSRILEAKRDVYINEHKKIKMNYLKCRGLFYQHKLFLDDWDQLNWLGRHSEHII